jgi:hypothetical protein
MAHCHTCGRKCTGALCMGCRKLGGAKRTHSGNDNIGSHDRGALRIAYDPKAARQYWQALHDAGYVD